MKKNPGRPKKYASSSAAKKAQQLNKKLSSMSKRRDKMNEEIVKIRAKLKCLREDLVDAEAPNLSQNLEAAVIGAPSDAPSLELLRENTREYHLSVSKSGIIGLIGQGTICPHCWGKLSVVAGDP